MKTLLSKNYVYVCSFGLLPSTMHYLHYDILRWYFDNLRKKKDTFIIANVNELYTKGLTFKHNSTDVSIIM